MYTCMYVSSPQHPFVTDFSERVARIQIKDQIDRMKRKKVLDEYEWSGSDEGGDSLEQPTIKKGGENNTPAQTLWV